MLLSPRAQSYLTFAPGFPGVSDAVEGSSTRFLSLHRETKLIIGFDFAVTLSSPESFCVLLQTQEMIPFITCDIPVGQYVGELVFWCQCI